MGGWGLPPSEGHVELRVQELNHSRWDCPQTPGVWVLPSGSCQPVPWVVLRFLQPNRRNQLGSMEAPYVWLK